MNEVNKKDHFWSFFLIFICVGHVQFFRNKKLRVSLMYSELNYQIGFLEHHNLAKGNNAFGAFVLI
ncbi:MAG: hypothetical protein CMK64_05035 [Pseudoalteromonas sp.]|nr:hypothetical protein [Pseudoalteromonas sp.]